ncbi:heparinase II/III domain-containing protein [Flavitalea flava]
MKRSFPAICVFLFLNLTLVAQTPRNLLHRFSKETILQSLIPPGSWHPFPQSPEGWKKVLEDTVIQGLIRKGEEAQQKNFSPLSATLWLEFVRTGNRVDFEAKSFAKRNQLMDLVLAESVEGKGRFSDAILNGIWSICEETFWGLPAHLAMQKAGKGLPDAADPVVDLFAAETASVMAWTDYLTGNALQRISPLIHERIYSEISRRIFQPIVTAKYEYMGYGNFQAKVNNWAPWIMSNYLSAVLLLEKDADKRADAVLLAMHYTDQYLNGLGDDGAGDEGPLYWFAAGGTAFDALTLLYDASGGKLSIFSEPFIQKMGAYVYKTHIAGRYFLNIADAIPEIDADGYMLYRYGKATGDKEMMHFGSWAARHIDRTTGAGTERFFKSRILYNLVAARECSLYPDILPAKTPGWFPDIQLMTCPLPNGLFIACHGGNNGESHNHNDVGDFILYSDGEPVIIDAGAGTYTARTFSQDRYRLWFNISPYHNLPTVNGFGQPAGLRYKATDVDFVADPSRIRLTMDLAKAYDSAAGISAWIRRVDIDLRSGVVNINDSYNFTHAHNRLTQSLMTVCETDISVPGKLLFLLPRDSAGDLGAGSDSAAKIVPGKKVVFEYDPTKWKITRERVALTEPEDEKIKTSWHNKPVWRILLESTDAGKKGEIRYRIHR